MADVRIRVDGNAGGAPAPQPQQPTPPAPSAPYGGAGQAGLPADTRMVEDMRRQILQQGAMYIPSNNTFKPIIARAEQIQRKAVDEEITQRYQQRRDVLEGQRNLVVEDKLAEFKAFRENELQGVTSSAKIKQINDKWDAKTDEEIERLVKPIDEQIGQLDAAEKQEKEEKQEELTNALKELTEAINKSGTLNPESYLGQLRQQRMEAIFERDNATDEESAREAAQRVTEIDQKIKDVTDGRGAGEEKKIDWGSRALQTVVGFNQFTKGMASGNLGSLIMGGGQGVTSMLGLSDEASAKTLGWLGAVAGVASLFQEEAQRSDQMAGLAALIRGAYGTGTSIGSVRENMYNNLGVLGSKAGFDIYDLGLGLPDFAQSAERRISQRGMSQEGVSEALYQEALERVLSLNRGSLGAAGIYDRYGTNATDAISRLVTRLEGISSSGVRQGDYARVQEYLGLQQGLMGNYMRFSAKPSYDDANRELAAFASIGNGYTVDSRTSGHIEAVRNQLLNPQNDRMRAVLYGVVEQAIPEYRGQQTRGRVDLIDQILHDTKYQGVIEKALMEKLTTMYGGFDTPMGYMMIKSQLASIESPELREKIWKGITTGKAGDILSGYEETTGSVDKVKYSSQVKGYTSDITKTMTEVSDSLFGAVSELNSGISKLISLIQVLIGKKSLWDWATE